MTTTTIPVLQHRNEVHLIGRVSGDPVQARLPSGDLVVNVRVVVERPRPPAGRGRRQKVDTLSCAAWTTVLRRAVMRWCSDDVVEVKGALHRRFWRGDGVPQSRYEVELTEARRLYRPPIATSDPDLR
ncbi:MAG TPA: single-stranded DNA-binding protein [Jiangellaceae bacterium]|nr:single-stranded DNA-binding protein [Jiangellaceae bacterium]